MCGLGISNFTSKITTSITRVIPSWASTSKRANRAISWIGKHVSSPQNRLILGATALMSQPFIDLHNRKVDEETRKVSAARTVAKIIAGTTTGFLIRYGCIKAIDYCCMLPSQITKLTKFPRLRTLFTPDSAISGVLKDLGHYKQSLGTIISLAVMVFTNFAIDAPLTKFLTNKFVDKCKNKPVNKVQNQNSNTNQSNDKKRKEVNYNA
ncbi:hypothetical protein IJ541_11295 [bacterium]|nr:hypothetical protein [bacterium]